MSIDHSRTLADIAVLTRAGQLASAVRLCQGALAISETVALRLALASLFAGMGRWTEALAACARAVALDADHVEARLRRAAVLERLGHRDAALEDLEHAYRVAPSNADVCASLGTVKENAGEFEAALELYDKAIAVEPSCVAARLNRGALRLRARDPAAALDDFDAVAHVGVAAVHINRARALFALHRDPEALAAGNAAVALAPGDVLAWYNKALAHCALGEIEAAQEAFSRARRADPAVFGQVCADPLFGEWTDIDPDPKTISAARALQKQAVCDWTARERAVHEIMGLVDHSQAEKLARHHFAFLFEALALPLTAAQQHEFARHIARAFPLRGVEAMPTGGDGRIRVGFVSADFRDHPTGWLLEPIVRGLSRTQFEVFLYVLNRSDGDAQQKKLQQYSDRYVDLSGWDDENAARRIAADGVDVLVECSGYLTGARPGILARRPAPVQVSYHGMPSTLGGRLVDYRVSDRFSTPLELQPYFSERLLLLPNTHFVYDRPEPEGSLSSREALGLPPGRVVYCCMSSSVRIEPDVFAAWMSILRQVPESVLWLLGGNPLVESNLRKAAQQAGIDAGRLVFSKPLPRRRFIANLAHADLFLDTLYYNAHTTALDTLWAGVPLLTCPGATMASRIAASILLAAGMADLVVPDRARYVATAVELGGRPEALRQLRDRIDEAKQASPAFDAGRGTAVFGRALEAVCARHRSGLPPETLLVD